MQPNHAKFTLVILGLGLLAFVLFRVRSDERSDDEPSDERTSNEAQAKAVPAPAPTGAPEATSGRKAEEAPPPISGEAAEHPSGLTLSWDGFPALQNATGRARAQTYEGTFTFFADTCMAMPASASRSFETAVVEDQLILQMDNTTWVCPLTQTGTFACPVMEESKEGSSGRVPHLERTGRGVFRLDGSLALQVQTRTWCEGDACQATPCMWSFLGTAVAVDE